MVSNEMVFRAAKTLLVVINKVSDETLPSRIARTSKKCAVVAAVATFFTGWLPVGGALVAAMVCAVAIWTMYVKINTAIEIPFSANLLKSILAAIGTNLAAYFVTVAIATLVSFIPGIGSLAAMILLAVATYAVTIASAYVYLNVLAKIFGKDSHSPMTDLAHFANAAESLANDSDLKEISRSAMSRFAQGGETEA